MQVTSRTVCRLSTVAASCLLTVLLLTACNNEPIETTSRTTDTTSAEFETAQERLGFAAGYFSTYGPATDVDFDIFFRDNATGRVPGPSDWDMGAAFKVDPTTVGQWEGAPQTPFDLSWAQDFAMVQGLPGPPEFSFRDGTYVAIYRDEGVVLLYRSTFGPLAETE